MGARAWSLGAAAIVATSAAALVLHGVPGRSPARAAVVPTPAEEHRKAGDALLARWRPHVEVTYGLEPDRWRGAMAGTIARASTAQLVRATRAASFDDAQRALLPESIRDASRTVASPAANLVYNIVTPCRVADTRLSGARIGSQAALDLRVTGTGFAAQGGTTGDCGVPQGAKAVAINVTAIQPTAAGYLTIYASDASAPLASSLNYGAGDIVGNEVVVQLSGGSPSTVRVFSWSGTDVAVDVVGYFTTAGARALNCFTVRSTLDLPPGNYGEGFAECPYGYFASTQSYTVGGNCSWLRSDPNQPNEPEPGMLSSYVSQSLWMICSGENKSAKTRTIVTKALCCNVVRTAPVLTLSAR